MRTSAAASASLACGLTGSASSYRTTCPGTSGWEPVNRITRQPPDSSVAQICAPR